MQSDLSVTHCSAPKVSSRHIVQGSAASTEWFVVSYPRAQVSKKFLGDNDRVKLLVLYCGEEDEDLAKAAAGALACLADYQEVCSKILQVMLGVFCILFTGHLSYLPYFT